ncbi:MAG: 4Fe-4S binding protein, partial [Bacteroidota bacterium]
MKFKNLIKLLIPFFIGLSVGVLLTFLFLWWPFMLIFPWIGGSVSLGIYIGSRLKGIKKRNGRKISMLLILPILLLFVPIYNNENFQLEGVALIVMIGFFGKGFIHYAIAKIFGPLIWRRGFCGWACWTAAILEWLPVKKHQPVPKQYRKLRFIALAISLAIPVILIFALSFDVRKEYIYKQEMIWMF